MQEFTVPPALERGDRVAIVAPAGGLAARFPHVYEQGIDRIESVFDLEPVEYPTATKSSEYLAAHPEERAEDVMDAFRDPDVRGVIATIGGNDQIRMLEHLDPDVLRDHPTRFYGYSDNTSLALFLWNLGVISFYGGMVMTEYAMQGGMYDHTVDALERALFAEEVGEIRPAAEFTDDGNDWADPESLDVPRETEPNPGWRWENASGVVEGRVWGGCLEILDVFLAGGRYAPDSTDLDDAVLALETSEELPGPAQVRRTMQALGERGYLERANALLVGRAKARSYADERPPADREAYRETQRETVMEVVEQYGPGTPVVFDLDFGHTFPTVPLPIGGRVTIDGEEERIAFEGA